MDTSVPATSLSRKERKRIARLHREELSRSSESTWQIAKKRILDTSALIGAIAVLLSFVPAFSVSTEAPPLNPSNVTTSLFLIEYNSPIPVKNVNPACEINDIEIGGASIQNGTFVAAPLLISKMRQGDVVSIPCVGRATGGTITSADITIRIFFVPILMPTFAGPWERDFRFITARQSDGKLRWVPEPREFNGANLSFQIN